MAPTKKRCSPMVMSWLSPGRRDGTFPSGASHRIAAPLDPAIHWPARAETATTAEGRVFTYNVERQPGWLVRREAIDPSGLRSVTVTSPAGTSFTTAPDGTTTYTALGPDPRFGMQAPILKQATITTSRTPTRRRRFLAPARRSSSTTVTSS
jgi:hypothetical protein